MEERKPLAVISCPSEGGLAYSVFAYADHFLDCACGSAQRRFHVVHHANGQQSHVVSIRLTQEWVFRINSERRAVPLQHQHDGIRSDLRKMAIELKFQRNREVSPVLFSISDIQDS